MYLAKQHAANLYDVDYIDTEEMLQKSAKKEELDDEAKELKEDCEEYVNRYGLSNCPHIPREHGEDTSLMVEIVEKN